MRPGHALPLRPLLVTAMLSLPPPLAVGQLPPSSPQVVPLPSGGDVPLGEKEEHGGVAGLHLGDLLLSPTHQVQGALTPDLLVFLGLVHLLLREGRSFFLLLEFFFAFTMRTSFEIGLFAWPLLYLTMAWDFLSGLRNPMMQPRAGWMPLGLLLARYVIKTSSFNSKAERVAMLLLLYSLLV